MCEVVLRLLVSRELCQWQEAGTLQQKGSDNRAQFEKHQNLSFKMIVFCTTLTHCELK